jgi:hypothetical protein
VNRVATAGPTRRVLGRVSGLSTLGQLILMVNFKRFALDAGAPQKGAKLVPSEMLVLRVRLPTNAHREWVAVGLRD